MKLAYTVCTVDADGTRRIISEGLDGYEFFATADDAETVAGTIGGEVFETRVEHDVPLLDCEGAVVG